MLGKISVVPSRYSVWKLAFVAQKLSVNIAYEVLHRDWPRLLAPAATLLRDYIAYGNNTSQQLGKEAREKLERLFDYVMRPVPGGMIRFYYDIQWLLVLELESWTRDVTDVSTCELYVDLLKHLCSNHARYDEMDYVNTNAIHMMAHHLLLNDYLKQIRLKTYHLLWGLYASPLSVPTIKLKILKAYESSFGQMLPFGGSTSHELMRFDAENLLPICETLARTETHLALQAHIYHLLKLIEKQLADGRANAVLDHLQSEPLQLYRKFFRWHWDEERIGITGDVAINFIDEFIAGLTDYTAERVTELIELLSQMQLAASLDNGNSWLMRQFFNRLGQTRSDLAEVILNVIQEHRHPLFTYAITLLSNLMARDPSIRQKWARKWISSGDTISARTVAWSYAYNKVSLDEEDWEILRRLITLKDENVDLALIDVFLSAILIEDDRAAQNLLVLTRRASTEAYAELIGGIVFSQEGNTQSSIHKSRPDVFRQIVFISTQLPSIPDRLSGDLSKCLETLCTDNLLPLIDYVTARCNFYSDTVQIGQPVYDTFPNLNLKFIRKNSTYREFLSETLRHVRDADRNFKNFWLDVLNSVLADSKEAFENEGVSELDSNTYETFSEWINGEPDQLKTVLIVLKTVHPWQSWFDLVRHIVKRQDVTLDWDVLMQVLYLGSHWGPTSAYYRMRLALVQQQRREDDSPQMLRFLDYVERELGEMIIREEERESEAREFEGEENW
ncbi:MAG: hypothetical protein WCF84_08615 [Anaerolineae bacterium]